MLSGSHIKVVYSGDVGSVFGWFQTNGKCPSENWIIQKPTI
jgi:hypothetical protein